jgi:tetratricopeptide (TPR) repeat protein
VKNIVRLAGPLILVLIAFSAAPIAAQSPGSDSTAKTALEQGVCAFKNKNYPLALAEFEKALQQDAGNTLLMRFRARAMHFQYDPKAGGADNIAKARSAIDAYLKLLAADPADDEAPMAIADLYEQIEGGRLPEIAADESLPKQVRTRIYLKLAAKSNTCANDITEKNVTMVSRGSNRPVRYHMPKNVSDLAKARTCASDGLKRIDKALALEPHNESAWSYKASLLVQMSRLAEMQQQPAEKAGFDKQASLAKTEFKKIADERRARQDDADREEELQAGKQQMTPDDGAPAIKDFYTTGRLRKTVRIDQYSIDYPGQSLLDAMPEDRKPQPGPAGPPLSWKTFTPPDGRFSALLPSHVDIERTFFYAKAGDKTYVVTYTDIPPDPPATVDQMMAGLAWGLATGVCGWSLMADASCDVRLSGKISLGAYPGIQYAVSEDNCIKIFPGLIRVYATPDRIYALAAIGGDENDPNVAKFLNSFAVKK